MWHNQQDTDRWRSCKTWNPDLQKMQFEITGQNRYRYLQTCNLGILVKMDPELSTYDQGDVHENLQSRHVVAFLGDTTPGHPPTTTRTIPTPSLPHLLKPACTTPTFLHASTPACTHTRQHARFHTCAHAFTPSRTHARVHASIHHNEMRFDLCHSVTAAAAVRIRLDG